MFGKKIVMDLEKFQMATENVEGYIDFDIDPDWYKNRKQGVSAVIRCYGEERWIGPCIESCLPLYDEILITLTEVEGDRTEDIVKSFKSDKIRVLKYPFKIFSQNKSLFSCDSVHQFSYYTNWSLSKTCFSHVSARWDADHILRPEYATKEFHDFILSKSNVRVRAFNVVTSDFKSLSETKPYQSFHARFAKVNPHLYFTGNSDFATYYGIPQWFKFFYWKHFPAQQIMSIKNRVFFRDAKIMDPIFFHTKLLKLQGKKTGVKGRFLDNRNESFIKDSKSVGKKIDVTVPGFVFKMPEDYLS